jgi:hypothetical protein
MATKVSTSPPCRVAISSASPRSSNTARNAAVFTTYRSGIVGETPPLEPAKDSTSSAPGRLLPFRFLSSVAPSDLLCPTPHRGVRLFGYDLRDSFARSYSGVEGRCHVGARSVLLGYRHPATPANCGLLRLRLSVRCRRARQGRAALGFVQLFSFHQPARPSRRPHRQPQNSYRALLTACVGFSNSSRRYSATTWVCT